MANRLELTWYGKDNEEKIESRILIEDKEKSYGELNTENMLIHGDNLLALKALEHKYAGQIKCIYIDPPYNTGSAFEHYDDNVEHSIWLNLMKQRLEILKVLLSEDGSIYVQIDNCEQAYLKVLMDEIFSRKNFVQMLSVKRASPAGFKVINPGPLTVTDYILLYAKNKDKFYYNPQRIPVDYDSNYDLYIDNIEEEPEKWVLRKLVDLVYKNWEVKDWKEAKQKFGSSWKIIRDKAIGELAIDMKERVVSVRDPHKPSGLIKKTLLMSKENKDKVFVIKREKYNPIYIYNGGSLSFYKEKLREIDGKLVPTELVTDFWHDINFAGIANEGGIQFKNSKKPEMLIRRILESSTNENDLVLDSFLGSGTTCAVAQKMNRRYIGIELGEHCYTHCIPRLKAVIDGVDQSGISTAVNWQGGGGFKFYELAPSLIKIDCFGEPIINSEYNAEMLASAVALHEGFTYEPSSEVFWKQSKGTENSFLYVTTRHITGEYLNSIVSTMKDDEYLIIACSSFENNLVKLYKNIRIKKIPQMLLSNCEFGKDNYNLNIINPPIYEDNEGDEQYE